MEKAKEIYKKFQDALKNPIALIAFQYFVVFFLTFIYFTFFETYISSFISFSINHSINTYACIINYYFEYFSFLLCPTILYIILFTRNKLSINPYIITLINIAFFIKLFPMTFSKIIDHCLFNCSFILFIIITLYYLIRIISEYISFPISKELLYDRDFIKQNKLKTVANILIFCLILFSTLSFDYRNDYTNGYSCKLTKSNNYTKYDYRKYFYMAINRSLEYNHCTDNLNDYHSFYEARKDYLTSLALNPFSVITWYMMFGNELDIIILETLEELGMQGRYSTYKF